MLAPLLVMMDQTGMAGESAGNALRKVFQAGLDANKVGKANRLCSSRGASPWISPTARASSAGWTSSSPSWTRLNALNSVERTGVLKTLFGDDAETLQVADNTLMAKGIAGYRDVVTRMQEQGDLKKRVDEQLQTTGQHRRGRARQLRPTPWPQAGATATPQLKDPARTGPEKSPRASVRGRGRTRCWWERW